MRDSRVPDNDGPWSILHMPAAHAELPPGLPPVEGLEDWQSRDLFASALYPHFLLGIQGSVVTWYQVFPESAGKLKLKIHTCVPRAYTAFEGFDQIADEISHVVDAIHQEDIGATDTVWKGLNAPMTSQGRLSPLEKAIWQYYLVAGKDGDGRRGLTGWSYFPPPVEFASSPIQSCGGRL
ncbi:SRPBCC family protein [Hyphomonas sp.]|uniref:SRPBCC family protein n=1 Tax=Hyphomonas sp. TaxID=87 RepID=UPI003568DD2D